MQEELTGTAATAGEVKEYAGWYFSFKHVSIMVHVSSSTQLERQQNNVTRTDADDRITSCTPFRFSLPRRWELCRYSAEYEETSPVISTVNVSTDDGITA